MTVICRSVHEISDVDHENRSSGLGDKQRCSWLLLTLQLQQEISNLLSGLFNQAHRVSIGGAYNNNSPYIARSTRQTCSLLSTSGLPNVQPICAAAGPPRPSIYG